ncbi:MAG: methionyl-tRNA formyltransferase [Oscillospiraceae bacterium]|nr:methionyl-tRNA formyltransferase [Oscillospiraceae bacterium]MBO7728602.1 methionyl-tRNA formyltransferase [Oscillospiraceae bacterium]MBP5169929.1 methionyl-tRNA formyltransferase [Oscillospiraceae bacterium]
MRIVFMGTPDFAAASLDALLKNGYDIIGVFTQPDKAKGRGMEISFSPVKELALAHALPVFQPEKMRDGTALSILQSLKPDLVVVVAYGRILPDDLLSVPPLGTINVHGSLLPRYRGAAPIQWSVLNGDEKTGVTTMYLSSEMDAGDIIYSEETEIGEYETSGELYDRLKELGANLLIKTVRAIEAGCAPRTPQDETQATYVSMLDKSLSPLDFTKPARAVVKWVYGLQPWPVATAELGGVVLKVFSAQLTNQRTELAPGNIVSTGKDGIEIACGDGETVLLTEVQAPGKKRMRAEDYLRGHKL